MVIDVAGTVVETFVVGSGKNLVYLLTSGGESVVVDPAGGAGPWKKRVGDLGSALVGILLTHTHADHVSGLASIAYRLSVGDVGRRIPVFVHPLEVHRLTRRQAEGALEVTPVGDGQKIRFGNAEVLVLHTPGHSAGACCFLLGGSERAALFTGDTIFVGDVGRTDLPTGSTADLFDSIQRIRRLPPDTVVYPGHDYGTSLATTVGRECAESPAFRCRTAAELDALP